jgi:hypothetical protein
MVLEHTGTSRVAAVSHRRGRVDLGQGRDGRAADDGDGVGICLLDPGGCGDGRRVQKYTIVPLRVK